MREDSQEELKKDLYFGAKSAYTLEMCSSVHRFICNAFLARHIDTSVMNERLKKFSLISFMTY